MIFSSSALCALASIGRSAERRSARVARERRTPFFSDMSESVEARSNSYGQLIARLDSARLKRDEPLAQYTTFRIGGPADFFYDATSTEDLAGAVIAAPAPRVEYFACV